MCKIRTDFVTNSSSSSFIISTNKEVPEQYKNVCKTINKDNLYEVFKEQMEWNTICYNDELLQKEANLNNEQMLLIKMGVTGSLDEYINIKKELEQSNESIYKILVDRDWLYYQKELENFINNSKIINHETDL